MAKKCSECRWYDGSNCGLHGTRRNGSDGGSCIEFVSHSNPEADHRCKSCRWYEDRQCKATSGPRNPSDGGACNKYSLYK